MKSFLVIVVCIAALTGTALASEQMSQDPPAMDRVIDGLGLLMDTPLTPVNSIESPLEKFA